MGRVQKKQRKRIDPMFTPMIRRNMSPASCKFGQSGRALQCRHGVPQTHTLKEMVGVGQATQRLSPDSSLLHSEHAAALLRIVRTVFCTPCFSGLTSQRNSGFVNFSGHVYQVEVIYSNLVLFQLGMELNIDSIPQGEVSMKTTHEPSNTDSSKHTLPLSSTPWGCPWFCQRWHMPREDRGSTAVSRPFTPYSPDRIQFAWPDHVEDCDGN